MPKEELERELEKWAKVTMGENFIHTSHYFEYKSFVEKAYDAGYFEGLLDNY